mgnify:CR=1 FL=1
MKTFLFPISYFSLIIFYYFLFFFVVEDDTSSGNIEAREKT